MDKLKLQTVYVPVAADKDTEYILSTNMHPGLRGLAELDNRIVLTPGELIQLFYDWEKSKYMYPDNFLKSKGIEI